MSGCKGNPSPRTSLWVILGESLVKYDYDKHDYLHMRGGGAHLRGILRDKSKENPKWWYAPWPSNCVKHTSGWLSMHIQSLNIFATYLDFYQGFPIFITCTLDFPQPCINSFLFAEHSDILTYHMTSSPDPTTWYWAPYDQPPIIPMTIAHGCLLRIIPFPCGTSPTYSKLIVLWTNRLREIFTFFRHFSF
jgi:hypothetical protein